MYPGDIFQGIPDVKVSGSGSLFDLLIINQAYPQPVGHLLLRKPCILPGFF
jgi:hypothetical protein